MSQEQEALSPEHLVIHQRMVERFSEAQKLTAQAQQLQARANELAAGFRVWAEDLHERYHLDASRGEGVNEDGTITRSTTPEHAGSCAPHRATARKARAAPHPAQ